MRERETEDGITGEERTSGCKSQKENEKANEDTREDKWWHWKGVKGG